MMKGVYRISGSSVSKLASVVAAVVLLSGSAVACTVPGTTGPVFCHGHKATMLVGPGSPRVISGTAQADVIVVTGGLHEVHGGAGDDIMCSDSLGSALFGDDGNDSLIGAAGNDRLFGGNGNDSFLGGGGSDLFVGGAGTDTVSYADHVDPVKASIDGRPDSGSAGESDTIDTSVENLTGGPSTNWLTGDSARNVLVGQSDNDRLIGGSGNDVLVGQGGNDSLDGQGGDDTMDGGAGVNGCDLDTADTSTQHCKFDMTPPRVTDFEVLTPTVNITAGQTSLQMQAEVTDNLSGVAEVDAQFCDANGVQDPLPIGIFQQTSGTSLDGIWTGTLSLSTFTKAGTYSVCIMNVVDNAKNLATLTNKGLAGSRGLPAGNFSFDIINNRTDTTAPVISHVVTNSPSVDVTNGDVTVTTDFDVMEAGSGIDMIQFTLHQDPTVDYPESQTVPADLITPSTLGASGSGHYRAVVQLPQGSAPGKWHVSIYARDLVLHARTSDTPLTVIDRNPITTLPRAVSITRTAGDTPYTQTFSIHMTSARAAIADFVLRVYGPGNQLYWARLDLVSGTTLDGFWTATIQLPPNAATGAYSVSAPDGYDSLGRYFSAGNVPGWTIS
jgi:hypothetical protein